ncbi:uncharacterized protein PV07_10213 [Cladophialophora immunda]|uniref:Uncharacterized protein n=1 Tax=Cladophialophora immunda TaxID=569365 RepID=A0A0D2AI05_9EURO|nr:uncharacterized protein PV07_10213 [Cladophialophora immunda]KIW24502.1 hypothetical protein PV07_10213 [Cladophialophora immunda]
MEACAFKNPTVDLDQPHEVFHHQDDVRGAFDTLPETPAAPPKHLHPLETYQPTADGRNLNVVQKSGELRGGADRHLPTVEHSFPSSSALTIGLAASLNDQSAPTVLRQGITSSFRRLFGSFKSSVGGTSSEGSLLSRQQSRYASTTDTNATTPTSLVTTSNLMSIQRLVADPDMPIETSIAELWTSRIQNRLYCELEKHVVEASWILELLMVGENQNKLKPTIVITCRTDRARKEIKKVCKELKWLKRLCSENDLRVVAHVQQFVLNGRVINGNTACSVKRSCVVEIPQGARTFCGQRVQVFSEAGNEVGSCTFGGLVTIGHIVYGITAGHPFITGGGDDSDAAEIMGGEDVDNESSFESEDPFISFDSDDEEDTSSISAGDNGNPNPTGTKVIARDSVEADSANVQQLAPASRPRMPPECLDRFHHINTESGSEPTLIASSVNRRPMTPDIWPTAHTSIPGLQLQQPCQHREHEMDDPHRELRAATVSVAGDFNQFPLQELKMEADCALIDVSSWPDLLPNAICFRDPRRDILIEGAVEQTDNVNGEVTVIAAEIGPQYGVLSALRSILKIGKSVFEVRRVSLERNLPRGVSGAWVVNDKLVCGHIIASRSDAPWAYMVSIDSLLDSIKGVKAAGSVQIPRPEIVQRAHKTTSRCVKQTVTAERQRCGPSSSALHTVHEEDFMRQPRHF